MRTDGNHAQKVKKADFRKDPSHRVHFIQTPNDGSDIKEFEAFQSQIFNEGIDAMHAPCLLLACLVGFDAVTNDNDAESAYTACCSARQNAEHVRIEWESDKRIDARYLSVMSRVALGQVKKWPSFSEAKQQLVSFLRAETDAEETEDTLRAIWHDLLKKSLAWLQMVLPPVLFGHVSKISPLSALPTTTFARQISKLALKKETVPLSVEKSSIHNSYIRAFDAAMLGKPAEILNANSFLKKLLSAMTPQSNGSSAAKRSGVLENLQGLAAEIDKMDEVCALLYIFALNLVENGTRGKKDISPDTPKHYIGSFALDFHSAAIGFTLNGIDEVSYSKIYSQVLRSSEVIPPYKAAGLKAFHLFLRAWWNVPKLSAEITSVETSAQVAANVVWAHEIERVLGWILLLSESRFKSQLATSVLIASQVMTRVGELKSLRHKSLVKAIDGLVIEIAREIRDGSEKSTEGRRRLFIADSTAIEFIGRWTDRISQESNGNDASFELLFDGNSKIYYWMNRLLKEATGDETISIHTLRHSIATPQFEKILLDDDDPEVNPLDLLANEGGHVGGHITAKSYCHLFESGIRHHIDNALEDMAFNYGSVSKWSGYCQATLRQRVARSAAKGVPRSDVLWDAIHESVNTIVFPGFDNGIPLEEPENPLTTIPVNKLGFNEVVKLLQNLSSGCTISQASMRCDVPEELVQAILEEVGRFAERYGKPDANHCDLLILGKKALLDSSGLSLGVRPNFGRLKQHRWKLLSHAIANAELDFLQVAVDYWNRHLRKLHLDVRPGPGWDGFINLIATAKINSSLICLKYHNDQPHCEEINRALDLAQASLHRHLGCTVKQFPQPPRDGRPDIWLIIGSNSDTLQVRGSANSVDGLHCAFLAAHLLIQVGKRRKWDLE